jgi:hypothetical protein
MNSFAAATTSVADPPAYAAVAPPSTGNRIPVTKDGASLPSHRAASAMSAGTPSRPIGCEAPTFSSHDRVFGDRVSDGAPAALQAGGARGRGRQAVTGTTPRRRPG